MWKCNLRIPVLYVCTHLLIMMTFASVSGTLSSFDIALSFTLIFYLLVLTLTPLHVLVPSIYGLFTTLVRTTLQALHLYLLLYVLPKLVPPV